MYFFDSFGLSRSCYVSSISMSLDLQCQKLIQDDGWADELPCCYLGNSAYSEMCRSVPSEDSAHCNADRPLARPDLPSK